MEATESGDLEMLNKIAESIQLLHPLKEITDTDCECYWLNSPIADSCF